MILLLLIPILVSGYIVFKTHPAQKYKLHRYDGQLLYIKTIGFGLVCTFLSILSVSAIETYLTIYPLADYLNKVLFLGIDEEYRSKMVWTVFILIGSYFFAYFWSLLSFVRKFTVTFFESFLQLSNVLADNYFKSHGIFIRFLKPILWPLLHFRNFLKFFMDSKLRSYISGRYEVNQIREILCDSPMDEIFFESYDHEFPLMLTLDDRKVYVGIVISLGEPTESAGMDQEIKITPFLSGYRDKETFEVSFTTFYPDANSDIELVIKQDKVISATEFDNSLFDELSKSNKTKDKTKNHSSLISQRLSR